jgi:hypothetical protein
MNTRPPILKAAIFAAALGFVACDRPSSAALLPPVNVSRDILAIAREDQVVDKGIVIDGTEIAHSFRLVNLGTSVITGIKALPSCACTSALLSTDRIEPGEELTISARVSTDARSGRLDVPIRVIGRCGDEDVYATVSIGMMIGMARSLHCEPTRIACEGGESDSTGHLLGTCTVVARARWGELVPVVTPTTAKGLIDARIVGRPTTAIEGDWSVQRATYELRRSSKSRGPNREDKVRFSASGGLESVVIGAWR